MRYRIENAKDMLAAALQLERHGAVCKCEKHNKINYHDQRKRRVIVCRKCSRVVTWLDDESEA